MYNLITILLAACSLAPVYTPPPMSIPAKYKETGKWTKITHKKNSKNSAWWEIYHDPILNQLEKKVTCNNENLKLALANFDEARALAALARSAMYPSIIALSNGTRQQSSNTQLNTNYARTLANTFTIAAVLNYEVDAWGRVRNSVLSSERLARASHYDLKSITLSLHALLATDYFAMRGAEESIYLLDQNVNALTKLRDLAASRFHGGVSPEEVLLSATAQLENAKTLTAQMRLNRATLEHAIAVLTGEIPSNFHLPMQHNGINVVNIAPNLPSTLIAMRPDIRAAADRVEAANAYIGVARAAFLPVFNLSGMFGQQSSFLSELLTKPSNIWAIGPSTGVLTFTQPEITQIIFDGFKLQAHLEQAKSNYMQTVSMYRQTVLTAFQQVEDALVRIHRLDEENQTQTKATKATKRLLYQASMLHKEGASPLMPVLMAKNNTFEAELSLINIRMQRQIASVNLIKALGGGFG